MSAITSVRFCLSCGQPLTFQQVEGRMRPVCLACGWIYYAQLKVGAAALLLHAGRLLLTQRSRPPFVGCWGLPAGYAEADEDPVLTVQRETFEETGLRIRIRSLAGAFYFDDDPRGAGVLLVYRCALLSTPTEIRLDPAECSAAHWFSPQEIPDDLVGAGQAPAIRAWQRLRLNGQRNAR